MGRYLFLTNVRSLIFVQEILDQNKFKEFYQFTFNYAKSPSQKGKCWELP
jgi:hypothetical protein